MFDLDENRPDYYAEPEQPPRPSAGDTVDFSDGDSHAPARRRSQLRRFVSWTVAVCVILLGVVAWFRYFSPYVTDSRIDGYVVSVERRGLLFKTYEAEIVSRTALADTSRVYSHNIAVSIPSEALARRMQSLQGSGRPVILTVERYWGVLPWRGSSTMVVKAMTVQDSADSKGVSCRDAASGEAI